MTISSELYWENVDFIHVNKKILENNGFNQISIIALHEKGLPEWAAPNMNFDHYLPLNGQLKIGEDRDDQSIYIDLKTMHVLLGTDGTFINSDVVLFRKMLKLYAEMVDKAISINENSFIKNEIPDNLIEEFRVKAQDTDKKSVSSNTFWIKEVNRLFNHLPD